MAITSPTYDELRQQAEAEIIRRMPDLDPTVFSQWASAFVASNSANAFAVVQVVLDLQEQLFPQTASGEFLEDWAGYDNLTRLASTASSGSIAQEGTAGTSIPIGTEYTSSQGVTFESINAQTVTQSGLSVTSIERVGTIATVITSSDHNYSTGVTVTISGADQTEYNGDHSITVTNRNAFTFSVEGSPTTPATGTISSTTTLAVITVESQTTGADVNVSSGSVLTLATPISGLSSTASVTIDGLTGGSDEETDEALRRRVLLSRSIIQGVFTENQIILAALGVAGNTRVFVVRPDLRSDGPVTAPGDLPAPGQVVIYILRDNDENIIPSQTVLNTTKQAIIDNGRLPANSSENDVFLFAPATVAVDFDFSSISPDTPTMRQAIIDQLSAFFEDEVQFQSDVTQAAYLSAINSTEDLQTNTFIETFSLTTPTGDVSISDGQIAILGEVTFA